MDVMLFNSQQRETNHIPYIITNMVRVRYCSYSYHLKADYFLRTETSQLLVFNLYMWIIWWYYFFLYHKEKIIHLKFLITANKACEWQKPKRKPEKNNQKKNCYHAGRWFCARTDRYLKLPMIPSGLICASVLAEENTTLYHDAATTIFHHTGDIKFFRW